LISVAHECHCSTIHPPVFMVSLYNHLASIAMLGSTVCHPY
jgi:hypothetical protein